MFAEQGKRVVALDLDPQANLTAAFLEEEELERIWEDEKRPTTIYRTIRPLTEVGDIEVPVLQKISNRLHVLPGDVALSTFEETLSNVWPDALGEANLYRAFRILSAFWQVGQRAADQVKADIIFVDVGPNLGAINRSALIGSDYVAVPLGADLFSLRGLQNIGPTLRSWRSLWGKRLENWSKPTFELPQGQMAPIGYIVQQHSVRLSRPVKAYDRWVNRIPAVYAQSVLKKRSVGVIPAEDPNCLATLKHYRSLMPMALEARKPIFELNAAQGAIGSHAAAVREAYRDFQKLAEKIQGRMVEMEKA